MKLETLPFLLDLLLAALLVAGTAFVLIGSWALAKLSDFHRRLHGPSKATTLGSGCLLAASALAFGWAGGPGAWSAHELLVALFLALTAPISAHLLVRAAQAAGPGPERYAEPPAAPPGPP